MNSSDMHQDNSMNRENSMIILIEEVVIIEVDINREEEVEEDMTEVEVTINKDHMAVETNIDRVNTSRDHMEVIIIKSLMVGTNKDHMAGTNKDHMEETNKDHMEQENN